MSREMTIFALLRCIKAWLNNFCAKRRDYDNVTLVHGSDLLWLLSLALAFVIHVWNSDGVNSSLVDA